MDTFKKDENYTMNVFQNGMTWLRADFHLHTNADKEFAYNGNLDYYYSNYIQCLVEEKIQVGVITNHNKNLARQLTGSSVIAAFAGILALFDGVLLITS